MRNGNFLRLKQIELGYNFKYGRIYITGDNLAVFSPFKEWDPEMGSSNGEQYPLAKVFTLGLTVNI